MSAVLHRALAVCLAATALVLSLGAATSPPAHAAVAREPIDVLHAGEELLPGEAVVSPNAFWALYLSQGTLAVEGAPSWMDADGYSDRLSSGVARVVLRTDGNLVALDGADRPLWSTGTANRGVVGLTVLDGGRVVLVDARGAQVHAFGRTQPVLAPGEGLLPGDQVRSPLGNGLLVMQHDGNLVYYRGGRAQWSTGSAGHPGAAAVFQSDGNLVVYTPPEVGIRAVAQTGSRVIRSPQLRVEDHEVSLVDLERDLALWGTAWSESELAPGDALQPGDRRTTRDGRCVLAVQGDQNVVEYCDGRPLWSTGTAPQGNPPPLAPGSAQLVMQGDGNLVFYGYGWNGSGPRWWTGTTVPGSRLVLQPDSNLVIYGGDGRATWSRATGRLR